MRPDLKLAALLISTASLLATEPSRSSRDHDEIRQLRHSGQIVSLEAIITRHRRTQPGGQLLEAELEFEQGRYVYELKILGEDGVVREFEYDACSGELWHLEPKPRK